MFRIFITKLTSDSHFSRLRKFQLCCAVFFVYLWFIQLSFTYTLSYSTLPHLPVGALISSILRRFIFDFQINMIPSIKSTRLRQTFFADFQKIIRNFAAKLTIVGFFKIILLELVYLSNQIISLDLLFCVLKTRCTYLVIMTFTPLLLYNDFFHRSTIHWINSMWDNLRI